MAPSRSFVPQSALFKPSKHGPIGQNKELLPRSASSVDGFIIAWRTCRFWTSGRPLGRYPNGHLAVLLAYRRSDRNPRGKPTRNDSVRQASTRLPVAPSERAHDFGPLFALTLLACSCLWARQKNSQWQVAFRGECSGHWTRKVRRPAPSVRPSRLNQNRPIFR